MAKKKESEKKGDQRLENIEETLTQTEQFIVRNQKVIGIVIAVVVVIILGYFGYQRYYLEPRTEEAQTQMYVAQRFFEADSLDKALYGDGNSLGFVDIVDDYGMTTPGNLANYYAGISFLKKENFEQAIDYLEDFDGEDNIVVSSNWMEIDRWRLRADYATGLASTAAEAIDLRGYFPEIS